MHQVAQQIIDQLSFLTPTNIKISSLDLSTRDLRSSTPTLVKAIAFSVSNRTDISLRTHHETVFDLLRQAEPLQRGLTEFLQALDPSSRECLVDNIFRHAVETGDPQATKMILEMAQSKFKYSVNPNLIKCTILERAGHFTPLEVAAVKRNVELTRVLLGVEANPNHTYWQGFGHSQGALEHALWTSVRPPDAPPPVNIEVVHLLLDHQAQVAALRGNTDLVGFMLPMVHSAYLQELLVLAIRSGETRLVDRLLQVGATVDGPATALITVSDFRPSRDDEKLPFVKEMTPLAEAIRCQDDILVRRLEDLGALSCIGIGKGTHFRAAATAAAYVGNLTYLRRICEKGSALDVTLLSSALTAAIACPHLEIAGFLLTHADPGGVASAMDEAIIRKNKTAFDLLVQFLGDESEDTSYMMRNAVLWGNVEVLDCLVRLGADVNNDGGEDLYLPLTIAALIGDKTILRWLLDHGAAPVQGPSFEPSPLAIAALHGDTEMVDILLAHHASVRDELALSFAMTYSQKAFETLLSEFVSKFPKGLPGFGSMLLNKAMRDAKVHQIKRLLEAGMDPSTPVRTDFNYESHEIEHLHEERENGWRCRILDESALLKRIGKLSPLGYAISMDVHSRLDRINMVRMLLEAGAEPNRYVGNCPRQTSFLLAVEQEDMDIIRLLVECRADVNLRPYGMRYSPLQQACQQGSLDVVMFLLQQGADVQAAPSPAKGGTALQMASRSGNVKLAQLLIDNGADVHEPPAQVGGRTSFEGAAEQGRITMLEFLWDQACPAGFPGAELERARSFAEEEGHRGCVKIEER
ncbi:2OG-Fe(II) oxygenase superfamily protein [Apiospora arundinis]